VLVELGTFHGTSYCGFCQGIAALDLATRAYAVDTWKGDPHSGAIGPEALADLREHHDPRYAGFSTLLEMTFDEAAHRFADHEIDLLHIDGYHTYEAVRHDFETWHPKLSDRGIVLFHDVVERMADFGVFRLWEELSARYPSFTFVHEHGLGVLAVGRDLPDEIRALVLLRGEEAERVRALFRELGRRVRLQVELDSARALRESSDRLLSDVLASRQGPELRLKTELERERALLASLRDEHERAIHQANDRLARSEHERKQLEGRINIYDLELAELHGSLSWRLVRRLSKLTGWIGPVGSRRRLALKASARLARLVANEGAVAVARRKLARAASQFAERSRMRRGARQPWRHDHRPVFLLISHRCGGGTERHLRELGAALREEGIRPLVVRPGRPGHLSWQEYNRSEQIIWCRESTVDRGSVERQLVSLRPIHAHVHHAMDLPEALFDLLIEYGVPYDWTIHDYHTICPRVNLLSAEHSYCGEPDAGSCNRCLARLGDDQGRPVTESITAWRERFSRRLALARRVFAPSADVRRRLSRYFPELNILLRPHFEALPSPEGLAAPLRPGEDVRVAVIGRIVPAKGSLRLMACARDARRRRLPIAFHVIGSTDRDAAFTRLGNVRITGPYREHEVYAHLAAQRCHLAFLPSLCPESFMYTLSTVMAARLFVCCFALGAQAERVRASGWGRVLPCDALPESINDSLLAAARSLADGPAAPPPPQPAFYPKILTSYYDFTADELDRFRGSHPRADQPSGQNPPLAHRRDHAHLH